MRSLDELIIPRKRRSDGSSSSSVDIRPIVPLGRARPPLTQLPLVDSILTNGYEIARGTLSITFRDGQPEWHFLAVARDKRKGAPVPELAQMMSLYKGVESFHVTPARH